MAGELAVGAREPVDQIWEPKRRRLWIYQLLKRTDNEKI